MLSWRVGAAFSCALVALLLLGDTPGPRDLWEYAEVHRKLLVQQFNTSSNYQSPPGCDIFKLSNAYPHSLTEVKSDPLPWKAIDFEQPGFARQYMETVLRYCYEGNLNNYGSFNWNVAENIFRSWYHTPWLHTGKYGREPIHGLTGERPSEPGYLGPQQQRQVQNWAIGFYNPIGASVLGGIWADQALPQTCRVTFPEGSVAFKLLFTEATPDEVPYLDGSPVVQALIWPRDPATGEVRISQERLPCPADLRLLQVDIAVKDSRATATGWVFGTFVYNKDVLADSPWKKLLPVGLMWGNDPSFLPASGHHVQECWINDQCLPLLLNGVRRRLGHEGRLDGPIDNQESSCLSCHSAAQYPPAPLFFRDRDRTEGADGKRKFDLYYRSLQEAEWFRNIRSGAPFQPGAQAMDYSLQVSRGLNSYYLWLLAPQGIAVSTPCGHANTPNYSPTKPIGPVARPDSEELQR